MHKSPDVGKSTESGGGSAASEPGCGPDWPLSRPNPAFPMQSCSSRLHRARPAGITPAKPAVLMKAEGTGPLFDIDNMLRVFEYNPNLWETTIEKDMPNLRDFIKGAWDNRNPAKTYMKILRAKGKA